MLGMALEKTFLMVGDNTNVLLNTTIPSSMLKKKHNAGVYHEIRETIASKVMCFCHLPSAANVADVLTKPLSIETFYGLHRQYLYRKLRIHKKA